MYTELILETLLQKIQFSKLELEIMRETENTLSVNYSMYKYLGDWENCIRYKIIVKENNQGRIVLPLRPAIRKLQDTASRACPAGQVRIQATL